MTSLPGRNINAAAEYFPAVKSDTTDLTVTASRLITSTAGDVKLRRPDGTDVVLTLPAGPHDLQFIRVWSTGTAVAGVTVVI